MKQEEVVVTMIRGIISEMPKDEQTKVHECAAKLRETIAEYGENGTVAMALVGAEEQVKVS
jgi:hypothetical protein